MNDLKKIDDIEHLKEEYKVLLRELDKNIKETSELKEKYLKLISEMKTMKDMAIKLNYGNSLKYRILKWFIR